MKKGLSIYISFFLILPLLFLACSEEDEPELFNLSVTATLGGSVSTSGGSFERGQQVTLTATPEADYVFMNWSGAINGTSNPITVNMIRNMSIMANFEIRKYPLTVNIEGEGAVEEAIISTGKTTDYSLGTKVRLTANPMEGWEFLGWTGDYEGEENPIEISVNQATSVTAHFEKKCLTEILYDIDYTANSYSQRFIYHHKDVYEVLASLDPDHGDHVANYGSTSISIDYNHDGLLDYISFYNDYAVEDHRNYIKFFTSDCDGNLIFDENNSNKFLGLVHGRKVITGDYNNDSFADIVFIGHGWDKPPFPGEYPIVLFGSESGLFSEKRLTEYVGTFHSGASGDIDNDGDLDLILTSGPNFSPILVNDGAGNFSLQDEFLREENRGTSRYTTEIYDINKDGFEDLITAGGEPLEWQPSDGVIDGPPIIYYGPNFNENYIILPRTGEDASTVTLDIGFYDINGDGQDEIFLYRTSGAYSNYYIQVLTLVNGSYVDRTSEFIDGNFVENKYPHAWMYIGDFDNDGIVELISEWDPVIDWKYDYYEKWELIGGRFVKQN
jgi:hypothetical protein